MKLADLHLAMVLQQALAALDDWPAGEAQLYVGDGEPQLKLSADELAAFVDWRRGELHRQLRKLGVEPEGQAPPANHEYPEERSGTAREAPSTLGGRIGDKPRSVGVQPAAPHHLARAEALEQATRIVMGKIWDEWQAGQLDDPGDNDPAAAGNRKFAKLRERRLELINQEADRLIAGPVIASCAECGLPADLTIGSRALCLRHAPSGVEREAAGAAMANRARHAG